MTEATPPASSFQTSLSAFQSYQKCEQQYQYRYVRRLKLRDQFAAPTLGNFLHQYLADYYSQLAMGVPADDAHLSAQLSAGNKYIPLVRGYANVAFVGGREDMARELQGLPALAGRLTDRYFSARGRPDADRYEVIRVEERMDMPLEEGIHSVGVVDLTTRDKGTGRLNLWEHKSTQNVPQDSVRLRDFQTMLYATKLRWLHGEIIDSVIWNYIRTREPTQPDILKSGHLTKRRDLDSTWETYLGVARSIGLDINGAEYDETRERLAPKELTVFFPRYEVVILVEESVLMDDYMTVARRMRDATERWSAGADRPVRTIDRGCDYCDYLPICKAALTGGDEADVIRMRYNDGKRV